MVKTHSRIPLLCAKLALFSCGSRYINYFSTFGWIQKHAIMDDDNRVNHVKELSTLSVHQAPTLVLINS